ncbi:hypothetical protein [Bacillus thuringiensis]|uniref:hypothetical protein n=1 Tax=Bacillus thuringiensis TaxID=1428 RepID=UPI00211D26AA|nr:hypothetical protein [Bacillus thuringiensis]
MLDKESIIVAASGNTLGLLIDYPVKYENVMFVSVLKNLTLDPSFIEWQCWKYLGIINKNPIKNSLGCKRIFLLGIVRGRGGALHMGKGRSNNAGKKQPNFDDSSNFAKQSQPTEKKKK